MATPDIPHHDAPKQFLPPPECPNMQHSRCPHNSFHHRQPPSVRTPRDHQWARTQPRNGLTQTMSLSFPGCIIPLAHLQCTTHPMCSTARSPTHAASSACTHTPSPPGPPRCSTAGVSVSAASGKLISSCRALLPLLTPPATATAPPLTAVSPSLPVGQALAAAGR